MMGDMRPLQCRCLQETQDLLPQERHWLPGALHPAQEAPQSTCPAAGHACAWAPGDGRADELTQWKQQQPTGKARRGSVCCMHVCHCHALMELQIQARTGHQCVHSFLHFSALNTANRPYRAARNTLSNDPAIPCYVIPSPGHVIAGMGAMNDFQCDRCPKSLHILTLEECLQYMQAVSVDVTANTTTQTLTLEQQVDFALPATFPHLSSTRNLCFSWGRLRAVLVIMMSLRLHFCPGHMSSPGVYTQAV